MQCGVPLLHVKSNKSDCESVAYWHSIMFISIYFRVWNIQSNPQQINLIQTRVNNPLNQSSKDLNQIKCIGTLSLRMFEFDRVVPLDISLYFVQHLNDNPLKSRPTYSLTSKRYDSTLRICDVIKQNQSEVGNIDFEI